MVIMKKEKRLFKSHLSEGHKIYGKRWNKANIGWAQDDDSIASKVYGDPCMIFTTSIDDPDKVYHSQKKYR